MMSSRKWKESNYRSGYHCYHYYHVCLSSRNFHISDQWPFHWFHVWIFDKPSNSGCLTNATTKNRNFYPLCNMHIMIKPKQTWCNNALWRFVETICSGKEVTLLFVSPYWITTSFVMGLNASKITYTSTTPTCS